MGNRVEVGRRTVTALRDHLADQLDRKVRAHSLVVWEDPAGHYRGVWSSLVPEGVRSEEFDGSWYELRRRIENDVANENPPKLVVYTPVEPPEDDPLAEVREAGSRFRPKLATLVKQSLGKQLSAARIAEIGREARTLEQAEAAAEGAGGADVRLVGVLGTSDPIRVLVEVLTGTADERVGVGDAWAAVADLAHNTVGADVEGSSDQLRGSLFRHLVLCDIAQATNGSLPDSLDSMWAPPSAVQQRSARDVLERLREGHAGAAAFRRLAADADISLGIDASLEWQPGLDGVTGTPALEEVLFKHATDLLSDGSHRDALAVADRRLLLSPWAADHLSTWGSRWRTVQAMAWLHTELARGDPPKGANTEELLIWYAQGGWKVDRAHRRLELARTELRTFGDIEGALVEARAAYDRWLDSLLNKFVDGVADGALDIGDLVRQGDIHDRFVAAGQGRTAYVWVDALRYELGVELAEALRQITDRVETHAAVAAAPTITQVGMANLLPGASSGLRLALDGDRIKVTVNGADVNTVADRRDLLRARHGNVADLDLNDASQKGEKALGSAVGDADLILVRSQEVDAAGESGLLSVAWTHFETVVNLLAGVIARLAQCGVDRVVVSADHGFIALSHDLGPDRTVDAPAGAKGTTKRRVFIGKGGTPNPATARVPLAACGIPGDLDLVVPRGLAVFRAGGGRQFFHGGLSPQELVVPVIVVELARLPPPQKLRVNVDVAGGRITTGVFAATLSFEGDLFTSHVTVRVVAGTGGGTPVARIVSGDGYDADTGAVTVAAGKSRVLTFQVIENLGADTEVELQVLDARTGRKLASSTAPVASPVVVEDRLD